VGSPSSHRKYKKKAHRRRDALPAFFASSHHPLLLTTQEAATLLRIHREVLYRLIKQNKIPCVIRIGGQYRFPSDIITRMMAGGLP